MILSVLLTTVYRKGIELCSDIWKKRPVQRRKGELGSLAKSDTDDAWKMGSAQVFLAAGKLFTYSGFLAKDLGSFLNLQIRELIYIWRNKNGSLAL